MSGNLEGTIQHDKRPAQGRGCLRWAGCVLVGLVASCLVVVLAGVAYQAMATSADERRYPAPGRLVDVGGYRLHIHCTGSGSPTVVLDSGLPGSSLEWSLVQAQVAAFARVCAYDRAGYAWSDPGPEPRTSRQIVTELHALLENGGIEGPYVLVGHSFGGGNVRLYAGTYPGDVAGVVLVDALHEEESARMPAELRTVEAAQNQVYAFCRAVAPLGVMRAIGELGLDPLLTEFATKLPEEVGPAWEAVSYRTGYCGTARSEIVALQESTAQMGAAGTLGDLPLVVLTSGTLATPWMPPGLSIDEIDRIHAELQSDLVNLSSNGSQVVAEGSGHYIHLDRPDLVVETIRQVVDAARQ